MLRVLIINGVNLNLLGHREAKHYGTDTLDNINHFIEDQFKSQYIDIEFFQSNIEGEIVNRLHEAMGNFDGIVINPGAYTHYSYAIRDAIESIKIPTVEVHLSSIHSREDFRKNSVTSEVCIGQISGFKKFGYVYAIEALIDYLKHNF